MLRLQNNYILLKKILPFSFLEQYVVMLGHLLLITYYSLLITYEQLIILSQPINILRYMVERVSFSKNNRDARKNIPNRKVLLAFKLFYICQQFYKFCCWRY